MTRTIAWVIFTLFFHHTLSAQDSLSNYTSPKFQSIELKLGVAPLLLAAKLLRPSIGVTYQYNILKGISAISYTESIFAKETSDYIKYNEYFLLQAFGIGVTRGKKRFNNSLFLLGGGRYYYSKATVNDITFDKSTYRTSVIYPELGLLYTIKIGKRKIYFTGQLYLPIAPIQLLKGFERFTEATLSFGVGYKIKSKK